MDNIDRHQEDETIAARTKRNRRNQQPLAKQPEIEMQDVQPSQPVPIVINDDNDDDLIALSQVKRRPSPLLPLIKKAPSPPPANPREAREINLVIAASLIPFDKTLVNNDDYTDAECPICLERERRFQYSGCKCNVGLCATCSARLILKSIKPGEILPLKCVVCQAVSESLVNRG